MKILTVLVLLLSTVPSLASDYCGDIRKISEKIINLKYQGIPANELMELLDNHSIVTSIVIDAYKEPTYRMQKNQDNHIREFADERYIWCIEVMNEKR